MIINNSSIYSQKYDTTFKTFSEIHRNNSTTVYKKVLLKVKTEAVSVI
jgi:hypothetical protein